MATGMPAARNGRAMSSARGYWFDWTPTRPTNPKLGSRRGVDRKTIDGRERVRRHHRAEPADDISVVVVMRWLDEKDAEAPLRRRARGFPNRRDRIAAGESSSSRCNCQRKAFPGMAAPRRKPYNNLIRSGGRAPVRAIELESGSFIGKALRSPKKVPAHRRPARV